MINFLKSILLNRNSILVFAVLAGLIIGDKASFLKDFTFIALAVTMAFSMTGISMEYLKNPLNIAKPMLVGAFLNYIVFSLAIIPLAWWLMPTKELFYGFVVIAAAPPGVAIIPFSYILKGKIEYAIIGVTGAFLASVVVAPLLVNIFASSQGVKPFDLLFLMIQLVIIPMIVSRFLLYKPLFKYIEPIRGKVVDWGFAVLIFVAVGMNRQVFFTNPKLLFQISIILFIVTFGLGLGFNQIAKFFKVESSLRTTQSMLIAIKSSGFSVFTALSLFGKEAAIPSAVMAVMVLLYLIFLSIRTKQSIIN
ncbi:MAG: bile acid:sodium symporter family protein [Tenuifilaceae bacterium]